MKKHICICGCEKEITFKSHYKYTGYPIYIHGHNSPWNKGIKGTHFSPSTEFKKGLIPWNKGMKMSDEFKEKISKSYNYHTNSSCFKEGHKLGFKKGHIGIKGMLGRKHKQESIEKYKEKRKNWTCPTKDTKIEVKIQNYLKQLNIEFFTHQYIKEIEHGYQCDVLIPVQERISKKIIIECFGNYWHNYPLSREIDIKRCGELREEGFRVLIFWENEIKVMELNVLKNILLEKVEGDIIS